MGKPVVHFEIVGRDGEALRAFYSELFGWEIDVDNPAAYGMVQREGNTSAESIGIGGAVSAVPERPSSTWRGPTRAEGYEGHVTVYVEVPDVEAALAQAERLGVTRLLGPDEVRDGLAIGAFSDLEGHLVGVVRSAT